MQVASRALRAGLMPQLPLPASHSSCPRGPTAKAFRSRSGIPKRAHPDTSPPSEASPARPCLKSPAAQKHAAGSCPHGGSLSCSLSATSAFFSACCHCCPPSKASSMAWLPRWLHWLGPLRHSPTKLVWATAWSSSSLCTCATSPASASMLAA